MSVHTRIGAYRKALPELRTILCNHPDVRVVGIGAKWRGGVCLGDASFVIGVERKNPDPQKPLPEVFVLSSGKYLTDVIETPRSSLRLTDGNINGGDILTAPIPGRQGTLGLVAEDVNTGEAYAMTCSHVVGPPTHAARNDPIEAIFGGRRRQIGHVSHQADLDVPIVRADLALVRLDINAIRAAEVFGVDGISRDVLRFGRLSAAQSGGAARPHMYYAKASESESARKFVCSKPAETRKLTVVRDKSGALIVMARAFTLEVDTSFGGVQEGHSGALLLRETERGDLSAVGMIFGGDKGVAYAMTWTDIMATLRVFGVKLTE